MSDTPNDTPNDTQPNSSDVSPSAGNSNLESSQDDRNMAMITHLSGIFAGILGPVILYLIKKDSSPYFDSQAKEAINFHITQFFVAIVCLVVTVASCGFLFFVMFIPVIMIWIFGIIAALAARDGKPYVYPMTIRLMK